MRRVRNKLPAPMREPLAFWLVVILFGLGVAIVLVAIYTLVAPAP